MRGRSKTHLTLGPQVLAATVRSGKMLAKRPTGDSSGVMLNSHCRVLQSTSSVLRVHTSLHALQRLEAFGVALGVATAKSKELAPRLPRCTC